MPLFIELDILALDIMGLNLELYMLRKDFKLFLEDIFQYLVACLKSGSIDCRFFFLFLLVSMALVN